MAAGLVLVGETADAVVAAGPVVVRDAVAAVDVDPGAVGEIADAVVTADSVVAGEIVAAVDDDPLAVRVTAKRIPRVWRPSCALLDVCSAPPWR